jgi:type I restriction enzyme S subunit
MAWEMKKLGDFLTLEYGKPLDQALRKSDGKYPVYGANGIKVWSNEFYYAKRTIIIGRKGSAGELTLTEEKFWPLDVTYFLKFDHKKYNLHFIYFLLSGLNLSNLATGVKPGINRNNVYSIEVNVPTIQEQKRIVAMLDAAFADIEKIRANTEQNLKNARELFESYLEQVFTNGNNAWKIKKLEDVVTPVETIDPRKAPKKMFHYIDVSSVSNKTFSIVETNELLGCNAPSRARRFVNAGDIIFATVRPTLRRIAIIPEHLDHQVCSTGYFVFRTKLELEKKFLFYYLQTNFFMSEMERLQSGTSYPAVNDSQIKNVFIKYPANQEQKRIVQMLDAVSLQTDKLTNLYKSKLTELDNLKKSLLHQAFSGQLTNQEVIA